MGYKTNIVVLHRSSLFYNQWIFLISLNLLCNFQQIATAANAGTSSGAYSAKPGSYGSSYGGGTSYDTLASTGPTGEYKGAGSGYTGSQTGKTGTTTGNTNSSGSSAADITAGMYAKSHVALNKVNVSELIKISYLLIMSIQTVKFEFLMFINF